MFKSVRRSNIKYLHVMRHSQAEKLSSQIDDVSRKLTSKGIRDCSSISRYFADQGHVWDLILCSNARRSHQSGDLIADSFKLSPTIQIQNNLYPGSLQLIYAELRALRRNENSVLLIGHNPSVQVFAQDLAGRVYTPFLRRLAARFPPGSVAIYNCDIEEWSDLSSENAVLNDYITPADT